LFGIDVSLNRQRARSNAHDSFVYKTDDEIDRMSLEEVQAYAKFCHNGWKDLIGHEEGGIGSICVTIGKCFMHSMIILLLDPHHHNF
jgi:hypothetical protein